MSTSKDYKTVCRIIRQLNTYSQSKWKELQQSKPKEFIKVIDTYKFLINTQRPIYSKEIEAATKEDLRNPVINIEKPFYLPPLVIEDKEFVPIMFVKYNMRNLSQTSYRIELIKTSRIKNHYKPQGFGFRFEIGEPIQSTAIYTLK